VSVTTVEGIQFLQLGQPWPPADQVDRLKRYSDNHWLFRGEHAKVFKDWIRLLRDDKRATLEIAVNFPGLISRLFADLLFGEQPKFRAGDEGSDEQQALDDLIMANSLHQANYAAGLAASYRGDAVYKVRFTDRTVIETVPAGLWFPVTDPDNVKQVDAHVLAWVKTVKRPGGGLFSKGTETQYLRAEIHFPGRIEHRLWLLKDGKITAPVPLATFYPDLPDIQETGVDDPLVVHIPNLELDDDIFGVDDYSEADTLFQELNVRLAQISRVLDKHTDPNMYGDASALERDPNTGEWVFKGGGKFFPVEPGGQTPGYVIWDAQLTAAFTQIERIIDMLYLVTDTSPAAFGQMKQGMAESGSALKRLLMRPLAKVNRKRLYFDPALKQILKLALALDRAQGRGKVDPDAVDISIEWQDGLPVDDREQADIMNIRTGGKPTISQETAIRRLDGGTADAVKREMEQIKAEEGPAPAAPRVTLPPAGGGAGQQPEPVPGA